MITVQNRYKGFEPNGVNNIPIYRSTPLGNPFKIGEPNSNTGNLCQTRDDVILAYEMWLFSQIKLGNQAVINALDEIAYKHLDGEEVNLICYCKPAKCHGDIIKAVIYNRLKELGYET